MAKASRHHGISSLEFTEGVRAISDISTNIIGIVATADDADAATFPVNKPVFVTSTYRAIDKAGSKGNLAKVLDGISDQADAQAVIVRVPHSDEPETLKSNIIGSASGGFTGLHALRRAPAITGYTPKILGVPDYDGQEVATELVTVAQALNAFCYASAGGAAELTEVASYRENFSQREIMLIDNDFMAYNGATGKAEKSTIERILGLRAKIDAETGWHKSISNVGVNGVIAVDKPRTFDLLDKNCDANTLNNSDITTLIRDNGFYAWGNRTCSTDPMYAFEVAVRSAQTVRETIARSYRWALDKPMHPSLLRDIGFGINAKLAEYVRQGRLLGGRVYVDEALNDKARVSNGIFRFDYEFTAVPPLENLQLAQHVTDTFIVNLVEKTVAFASDFKATTV
ncbi:phage tail sheath subtilisin-like domain-containing protein [Neisseria sp. S1]|uniref:phage tail sheath subtilisin-like domain-containing protein n=1 Tax=Neisseria sp. S1 TaxID=3318354 RepID=UPI003A884CCF